MDEKITDCAEDVKQLPDEELGNVSGGMKIVIDEQPSLLQSILRFIFKIKS